MEALQEVRHNHEQCRLANPGGTDKGDGLSASDSQSNVAENVASTAVYRLGI